jgi:CheY-like chemotaxis protein
MLSVMGSELELDSPRQGGGSVFHFTIGLDVTEREPSEASDVSQDECRPNASPDGGGGDGGEDLIVLVDDEEDNLFIMGDAVQRAYYNVLHREVRVLEFSSAEEALQHLTSGDEVTPAIIVTDERLATSDRPNAMPGSSFVRAVRAMDDNEALRAVPFVLCSGNSMAQDVARYKASGADLVWSKPIPRHAEIARQLALILPVPKA